MTKDEILQVLRLTAMGRANHPLQDKLADALERVIATLDDAPAIAAVSQPTELPKRRGRPPKKVE